MNENSLTYLFDPSDGRRHHLSEEKASTDTSTINRHTAKGNLLTAQGLYLFYFMALGSLIPFINLYFERSGMSGVQIGVLAALPVLVGAGAAIPLGGFTDAYRLHRLVLRLALILCPAAIFLLSRVDSFAVLIPIISLYAISNSPIVPLLDSSALEVAGQNNKPYGALRLWGSVGWAFSTVLIGYLIQRSGIRLFFSGYIVFIFLAFMVAWFQPPRKEILRSTLGQGLKNLLDNKIFMLFLVSVFIVTLTSGGVMAFFSIYMDAIGAKEGLIGLSWALSALSELPVMAFSGKIIRRIGSKGILTIGIITYIVRWVLFSIISNPYLALLVQLLHGLAFASFLVGSVNYINEHAPTGLSTTALAIFNTIVYGFGSMSGSLIGGYIYDRLGLVALFQIFSLIAVAGLAVFILGQRSGPRHASQG